MSLLMNSDSTFQLEYLEPPSQAKHWLQEQQDLDSMHTKFFLKGARITLWCEKVTLCKEKQNGEPKKKVQRNNWMKYFVN